MCSAMSLRRRVNGSIDVALARLIDGRPIARAAGIPLARLAAERPASHRTRAGLRRRLSCRVRRLAPLAAPPDGAGGCTCPAASASRYARDVALADASADSGAGHAGQIDAVFRPPSASRPASSADAAALATAESPAPAGAGALRGAAAAADGAFAPRAAAEPALHSEPRPPAAVAQSARREASAGLLRARRCRRRARSSGGLPAPRAGSGRSLRLRSHSRRSAGGLCAGRFDHRERRADRQRLALGGDELRDHAGPGRRNFGVNLVGRNFAQRLVLAGRGRPP